jgi:hypothetical protein
MNWNNLHSLFVFNRFGIFQEVVNFDFSFPFVVHCEREHRAEMTGKSFSPESFGDDLKK